MDTLAPPSPTFRLPGIDPDEFLLLLDSLFYTEPRALTDDDHLAIQRFCLGWLTHERPDLKRPYLVYDPSREQFRKVAEPDLTRPLAAHLYDPEGMAVALALDLDPKGAMTVGEIEEHAAEIGCSLDNAAVAWFGDMSHRGGVHVFVILPRPMHLEEVKPLVTMLGDLFPSIDRSVMANPMSTLTMPGSPSKPTRADEAGPPRRLLGWPTLEKLEALRSRGSSAAAWDAWVRLVADAHEIYAPPPVTISPVDLTPTPPIEVDSGYFLPRHGIEVAGAWPVRGKRSLPRIPQRALDIGRTGKYQEGRRSEAAWYVVCSYYAAGYTEEQWLDAVENDPNLAGYGLLRGGKGRSLAEAARAEYRRAEKSDKVHVRGQRASKEHLPLALPEDLGLWLAAVRRALADAHAEGGTVLIRRAEVLALAEGICRYAIRRTEPGKRAWRAALRYMAQASGLQQPALRDSRDWLVERGLLITIGTTVDVMKVELEESDLTAWAIALPEDPPALEPEAHVPPLERLWAAEGWDLREAWIACQGAVSLGDLDTRLGIGHIARRRLLNRLEFHGLYEPPEHTPRRLGTVTPLNDLAETTYVLSIRTWERIIAELRKTSWTAYQEEQAEIGKRIEQIRKFKEANERKKLAELMDDSDREPRRRRITGAKRRRREAQAL